MSARRDVFVALSAVLAAVGVLTAVWAVGHWRGRPSGVQDRRTAVAMLLPEAESLAGDIRRLVTPAMRRTRLIAAHPETVEALRSGERSGLIGACDRMILGSTEVDAVVLYDATGRMVGINSVHADGRAVPDKSVFSLIGRDYSALPIVGECLVNSGRTETLEFQTRCQITPVYFGSSGLSVAHSVPVLDPDSGALLGVASTRMRIERLAEIVEQTRVAGGRGRVLFVSDDGEVFDESSVSGGRGLPVPGEELREILVPLVEGHTDHALLKRGGSYLALFSVGLETSTPGGVHALVTAPEAWVESEAMLLRVQRAAIVGLVGVLLVSLSGTTLAVSMVASGAEAVRRERERFEHCVRGTSDGLWDWDLVHGRAWYSPRFRELLGYGEDSGGLAEDRSSFEDRLHPDDREATLGEISAHLERGSPYDLSCRLRTRSGGYRWFRARGRCSRDASGRAVRMAGSIRDITRQTEMEEELRASEARVREERTLLAEILSTIPFCVFWKDLESRYLGCNAAFAEAAGLGSPEEVVGLTDFELPWSEEEARCYRSDDGAVMRSGEAKLHIEETQRQADGRVRVLSTSKVPLRNNDGETIGVIGTFMDVTERRQLETQLAQAQKLESIGQLAAGIAHEINTPTQFISDNVRFLRDNFGAMLGVIDGYAAQLDPGASPKSWEERAREIRGTLDSLDYEYLRTEIPEAIEQSLEGLERVSTIIRAMKDFSHPARCEKEALDLNKAIETTATICRNRWKYVAELEFDFDPDLPHVECLGAEINQVFLNLIVNASDALATRVDSGAGERGRIVVRTRRVGGCVEVRVIDNGPGIPAEILGRVFDPFFTTKEVGAGTGQGLAICRDVVRHKHGGSLTCESTPGVRTEFVVVLPISAPGQKEAA
ncbi:MAG: ATP-binding protein [Phycisphaerales bacterium JB040]